MCFPAEKKPLLEEGEAAVDPNAELKLVKLTKKEIKKRESGFSLTISWSWR